MALGRIALCSIKGIVKMTEKEIAGVMSITLTKAKADGLTSLTLYGGLSQESSPSPSLPKNFTCNNGVIKVNSQGQIYADGTTETVEDELSNTATAEMLLAFDTDKDTQEVLTGAITRKVGIKVLDGTETTSWTVQNNRAFTLKANLGMSNCKQPSGTSINSLKCSHFSNTTINAYGNVLFNYTMSSINVSTVTDWNNFLATQYANGTPVIVVYPLITATTETVTGQTLSTQAGTNTIEITQASLNDLELKATYLGQAD